MKYSMTGGKKPANIQKGKVSDAITSMLSRMPRAWVLTKSGEAVAAHLPRSRDEWYKLYVALNARVCPGRDYIMNVWSVQDEDRNFYRFYGYETKEAQGGYAMFLAKHKTFQWAMFASNPPTP